MLSDEVRARLERLNRMALPEGAPRVCEPLPPVTDESELPAGQAIRTPWGAHWQIQQPLRRLWPRGPQLIAQTLQHEAPTIQDGNVDLHRLQRAFPNQTVFLDLETCGFAGSIIFLAGVMHQQGDELVLSQLWARDYSEEKSLLHSLWTLVGRGRLLITFNGKSFDWPQVQDRSTVHHLGQRPRASQAAAAVGMHEDKHFEPALLSAASYRPEIAHFDLLHHARRRWRTQLPNCKLQTLERYICGRNRVGDIPGRDIPPAYHDYVRTGTAHQMKSILHHNALDLVTLLQLSLTFVGDEQLPAASSRRAAS